jgi:hypothetical protein
MLRRLVLLCAIVLLPFAARAEGAVGSAPSAQATPPAAAKAGDKPVEEKAPVTNYVPGLEQFMGVILTEHAKLWYAGEKKNWPLADYQLGEIKEIMSDVQDVVPTFKNLPLADMLDAVITGEIATMEKAIAAKDAKAFASGYDKLTQACNNCHQATGNGFVVIQRPAGPAFPNQDFRPH